MKLLSFQIFVSSWMCSVSAPTPLAGGQYESFGDVAQWADLALDLGAIREAVTAEEKLDIYQKGRYATYNDTDGNIKNRTLARLSLDSFDVMGEDAMYSFFRHGFLQIGSFVEGEEEGLFDEHPANEYANTLVEDLFLSNKLEPVPEAIVALNIWMYIVHQLYDIARACKRSDDNSEDDMIKALDIAAALWIGTGQEANDNDTGNMFYNLAERAAAFFSQEEEGKSLVNKKMLELFLEFKLAIEIGDCNSNSRAYGDFRALVRRGIGYMTIPLVQMLIHHIMEEANGKTSDYIEMYALAIGPRVEACDPTAYSKMLDLFVRDDFQDFEEDEAIALIQSIYSCLEIDCKLVGDYKSGIVPQCNDEINVESVALAGYPLNFNVISDSRIDRDIEQIRILTKAKAYDAAIDYYQYGYNSVVVDTFLSLQNLATSTHRKNVTTQFDLFSEYYGSDDNYGDTMILNILERKNEFIGASADQITEAVTRTLTNVIMYMAVLEKSFSAIAVCNISGDEVDTNAAVQLLDQAVAFYVGSIEGQSAAGRDGGQLLFNSAQEFCNPFGVCDNGIALSNEVIIQAFIDASIQLTQSSCDSAEKILLDVITPSLLVPLIQGTLYYAVLNDGLPQGSQNGTIGAGTAFANSILPLINAVDNTIADTISENLKLSVVDTPMINGANTVFLTLREAIPKMSTPRVRGQCPSIGSFANGTYADVCEYADSVSPTISSNPATTPSDQGGMNPSYIPTPSPTPGMAQPTPPTDLGLGRYTFENDVTTVANLALDVKDMISKDSATEANSTYIEGGNAFVSGGDRIVSLAALSRTAADDMDQDPMFNLYRWALLDESVFDTIGTADFNPMDSAFGDIVVQKALAVAKDVSLAAETAVVMNVWMEMCHELYNAVDYCQDEGSEELAVTSIDRAVALWIGSEQVASDFDTGYMMYHKAQEAAQFLGLESGEASVNTEILDAFVEFQKVAKACNDDSESFRKLKVILADVLRLMTIPLIQKLIYYVDQGDQNRIELYALSVVPQAVGCGSSDFIGLRDTLVSDSPFDSSALDDIFYEEMRKFNSCLRITCDDLKGNSNPSGSVLELLQNVCPEAKSSNGKLAGFEPINDVYELSRIDLDILQIEIFMETKAYGAAMDYYVNGYNSRGGEALNSLSNLATSPKRTLVPQFETFSQYFGTEKYADDAVQAAIRRVGSYVEADRAQAAEAVTRILQAQVTFMAVLERLHLSVKECKSGSESVSYWEEGVALFVGSLEGVDAGGNEEWDGTLLYSLGKEICSAFSTCESNGDASINLQLLRAFQGGRDLLNSNDCDGALNIIEEEIDSGLLVSIIEATLFFGDVNSDLDSGNQTYTLASAFVLANSILPLIDAINSTSAETISRNLDINPNESSVPDGIEAVFEAITFVVTGLGIACNDIGSYNDLDVCNTEVVNPVPDTPTNLGNGIYTTTTYVEDRAKIAQDVVDIMEALESGSLELAKDIYKEGENSKVYNEDGIQIGHRTLQKFSTEATRSMGLEPVFNIFCYGLEDENGKYLGSDVRVYADSIVQNIFDNYGEPNTLAGEAMVALNLWMYLVHQLFETLQNCKNKVIADEDGVHSIDEAVAYWIGDGQVAGDGDNGHLFYALAERMGDKFQINVNGQSRTNVNILRLFNQAKIELSFPDACTTNPNTYVRLRQIIYRILTQMTIPLMQSLIHNLRVNDQPRVKLYAQAVVPLIAACSRDTFEYLSIKLISGDYSVIEVDEIVERLRASYECFGISCDDVGQHVSETDNLCVDISRKDPFAGYVPNTDVREYAQLDLDILETRILMEKGAYSAVEDLYTYGKHAIVEGISGPEMLSLYQMASTSGRSVIPQFDSFVRYFENKNYADNIIKTALDKSKLPTASDAQRTSIVFHTMQYMVIYMGALQAMHDAIFGCQSGEASRMLGAREAWDRAAALLIGSIEGNKEGGKYGGQSFYALAKERCAEFDTCGKEGFSEINVKLLSLLYTGRGEVEANSCGTVSRTVSSIESALLVPLIQSVLHYSIINSKLSTAPSESSFADGYIFSRAILPLVQDVDRAAADSINHNMDFQFERKPVIDGPITVFAATAKVYTALDINCDEIGTADRINACTGVQISQNATASHGGVVAGIVLGVAGIMVLITIVVMRIRKRSKSKETVPIFRPSQNGVMNYDSDILAGKHNDASILDGDEMLTHSLQRRADSFSLA